jgi:two-component system, sensor histidine kinase and response regulator
MNHPDTLAKILVVDDNPKNIQVIGTILRDANLEVGFALNGKQALELLQDSGDYDLVLLDIWMPVMNGYEVSKVMKNDEGLREIPIIFLSASHELENLVTAFAVGGVDYVTKPFNAMELLARVNTHLQLKKRTLEVKTYAQELEKLNATKDKFFSIIAHDLKNPFEGILLVTKGLLSNLDQYPADVIRDHMELIVSATESGHKLLENLLAWSRSQTGGLDYNPVEFGLAETIRRNISLVSPQAKAKNIRILFEPLSDTRISADEDMFCHILRNLLTNAIKFTAGPGTITIEVSNTPESLRISVTDSGIGISKEDQERLFRIDGKIRSRPGTSNETGSGLGLILCREFLNMMGGTISVDSEPGKGSRFTFTLPVT